MAAGFADRYYVLYTHKKRHIPRATTNMPGTVPHIHDMPPLDYSTQAAGGIATQAAAKNKPTTVHCLCYWQQTAESRPRVVSTAVQRTAVQLLLHVTGFLQRCCLECCQYPTPLLPHTTTILFFLLILRRMGKNKA